jgi:hypothetical protein
MFTNRSAEELQVNVFVEARPTSSDMERSIVGYDNISIRVHLGGTHHPGRNDLPNDLTCALFRSCVNWLWVLANFPREADGVRTVILECSTSTVGKRD